MNHLALSARSLLAELVACKDLKERAAKLSRDLTAPDDAFTDAMREYNHRQPLAWAAAREYLNNDAGVADDPAALIARLREPIPWDQSAVTDFMYVHEPQAKAIDALRAEAADMLEAMARIPREPDALLEIANERARQISVEDWSPAHDDEHDNGCLAAAAASYALFAAAEFSLTSKAISNNDYWWRQYYSQANAAWPFDAEFKKPKNARRDLIRAGALIVAELQRLDRAAPRVEGEAE